VAHFTGKDPMAAIDHVILVDQDDSAIGTTEKLHAHQAGLCHRAFSVFIFCHHQILLQQRAAEKYHSPHLWTNTCCSHPYPGEDIIAAGRRRLQQEMGIDTPLKNIGSFHYIAHFDNGLIENEIDHVLVGSIDDTVCVPNPQEVQAYRWISPSDLQRELNTHPSLFTPWLSPALALLSAHQAW
jgi:isopentenyl-diphosphate delta-isomerase